MGSLRGISRIASGHTRSSGGGRVAGGGWAAVVAAGPAMREPSGETVSGAVTTAATATAAISIVIRRLFAG
ncbi:hypothetical protein Acor_61680 [Acrocarpospora corrugata]|uniref:Uncharacterized protein n=1 Tax=Acrocarpospora corrugata TaxID=35763 RepID=A0A5M3W7Z1_9ACTN|nr:hypothetical protein Acor_61680 [Acrocarpospora corrugata]